VLIAVVAGLVLLALVVGSHWYVWRRTVRDTTAPRTALRRTGTAVVALGPVLAVAAVATERSGAPFLLVQVLSWPGFLWLVVFLYLLLALLAGELVRPVLRRVLARRDDDRPVPEQALEAVPVGGPAPEPAPVPAEPDPAARTEREVSRRLFIARTVGGAAAAVAVGTVGHGLTSVLRGPRVLHVTVPLRKLPASADGFRIAVVSDLHLGPVLGRGFAQRVVDTVDRTGADLVAVVGDLVDGDVEDLAGAVAPLAQLRARSGVFFVTGNHEYYSGADQWVEHVRELGLRVLANERVELPGFDLAGVDDLAGRSVGEGPDFRRALGDRDPGRTAVLLAHQPVVVDDAVRWGVDLQLSGHTHGGQVWPGPLVAKAFNPTVAGLDRFGDTQLYVTRGAGAWGPPVRVGAPPDVTVIRLAATSA
jgi:predicted MPP superfamily phosphohydrolase/uncharacterized protein YjeT (DUF2065 family)